MLTKMGCVTRGGRERAGFATAMRRVFDSCATVARRGRDGLTTSTRRGSDVLTTGMRLAGVVLATRGWLSRMESASSIRVDQKKSNI